MKKKILAVVLVTGTLLTGAYAKGNCENNQGMMNKKQVMMQHKNMHKGVKHGMQGMFGKLNLSSEQKYKISILRDEMKLEMKKLMGPKKRNMISTFITNDGFDRDAFIKNSNDMHQKMQKIRADFMEKAFKILTKEQIKNLKS